MSLGLRLPSDGLQMQGEIGFDGLGGLFIRTAWSGLDGKVAIDLSGDQLDAHTSGLSVGTVNPGIALSNIQIAGRYRSTTEQVAVGTLKLGQATAELLGVLFGLNRESGNFHKCPCGFPWNSATLNYRS